MACGFVPSRMQSPMCGSRASTQWNRATSNTASANRPHPARGAIPQYSPAPLLTLSFWTSRLFRMTPEVINFFVHLDTFQSCNKRFRPDLQWLQRPRRAILASCVLGKPAIRFDIAFVTDLPIRPEVMNENH